MSNNDWINILVCPENLVQAAVGFEPTNNGFANRRLGPLGYAAGH